MTQSMTTARARKRRRPGASIQVTPLPGEAQFQFFMRAFRALRQQIPSANRRTLKILRVWSASPNAKALRLKALEQFPADRFVHTGPRCVFVEHIVPGHLDQGQPEIRYGRAELQQLVDWANYRILNAGNFAPISDGHTPSSAEKRNGVSDPDVLGYAGPFYLGLLGDLDPQWAIYADEWIHQQDLARIVKLQRRSPEVWANEPIERRTMDPIAALGAATPCLDSGMNPYCRCSDGRLVMRYSASTFSESRSTFTPDAGSIRQRPSGDDLMPVRDDDRIRNSLAEAVGQALQAILPNIVQTVQDQLGRAPEISESEQESEVAGVDDGFEDSEVEDDFEIPAVESIDATGAAEAGASAATRYSRGGRFDDLSVIVARQAQEIQRLRTHLHRERTDIQRYSRLLDLAQQFAFDPREEFEACQDLSDVQFQRHCERTVAKYARRDDVGYLDLPDDLDPNRYSRSQSTRINPAQIEGFSREAASIAASKNAAQSGSTTFEAEFDAICNQHGISL